MDKSKDLVREKGETLMEKANDNGFNIDKLEVNNSHEFTGEISLNGVVDNTKFTFARCARQNVARHSSKPTHIQNPTIS